jgi:A/G-specific adenine glycosylase
VAKISDSAFRRRLLRWYDANKRDLPWRRTRDPYRIWVSEIMLQQTRVAAALPYYERFLERFPDVGALALSSEAEVLAAWAGLGYYSRARNLHRAAKLIAKAGFPRGYEAIRALPGVGEYTAAAIASIAFGEPRAAVDGNVGRVITRLENEPSSVAETAARLLDRKRPGEFNQALMELGATLCLPREPRCGECPVAALCAARRLGRERELPVKRPRRAPVRIAKVLLVIRRNGRVLMCRQNGFWELPEPSQAPEAVPGPAAGTFRHTIMNRVYTVRVIRAKAGRAPAGMRWLDAAALAREPVSTMARKALGLGNPETAGSTAPLQ